MITNKPKLAKVIKQFFCKHDFGIHKNKEVIGVTYSWTLRPTRCFKFNYECSKCGKLKSEQYIMFKDRERHAEHYDSNGWPIDCDGKKLEIVD